ncbi:hypothetical protein AC578_8040 [Pseudocercospora eumusae]|uniref:Major facilitator superfamily (MFS) profile domain-containing protein n=1 Tax=Pseudocercospora eumusae TaxID=321146 RepID=A0A139HGV1_9PEZI|nr:hypothetical protein AC578_8040 [Pseudocercospora eumusae]
MTLSPSLIRLLIVITFAALGSCTLHSLHISISIPRNDLMPMISEALSMAGVLLETLSCIATADQYGRRKAVLFEAVICVVDGGLQSGSVHIGMYPVATLIMIRGLGLVRFIFPHEF